MDMMALAAATARSFLAKAASMIKKAIAEAVYGRRNQIPGRLAPFVMNGTESTDTREAMREMPLERMQRYNAAHKARPNATDSAAKSATGDRPRTRKSRASDESNGRSRLAVGTFPASGFTAGREPLSIE